jgi:hypothetical protein
MSSPPILGSQGEEGQPVVATRRHILVVFDRWVKILLVKEEVVGVLFQSAGVRDEDE